MTPEQNLRQPSVDPLVALSSMGTSQVGGAPSADQIAEGVRNTLKMMMALAVSVAESAPSASERMKEVRNLAIQTMLQVQNMSESSGEYQ